MDNVLIATKAILDGLPRRLRAVIERALTPTDAASDRIAEGNITVDEWLAEMEAMVAQFHQTAAMAGLGSQDIEQMEPLIQSLVAIQNSFLDNFANDIRANGWLPSYHARAQMYASAIKQAYWNGDVARQAGGRVLPLPAMPAEGTQCLSNCKCRWRIETINAANRDYDAYWERHVRDSCQTCIEREAQWSPVRIRQGELQ